MQVSIARTVATAVTPSPHVLETASMFGLGVDDGHQLTIVPPTTFTLPQSAVVFITGPSGGGKSTVLSLIAAQCSRQGAMVIDFNSLPPLADVPLVDVFDLPLQRATALLAAAGLGDAFVMLRKPSELSDGQRYRLRLAQAMTMVDDGPCVVLADEFGATLDRMTAKIIAANVRKWVQRTRCTVICATTHDDLLEPLAPHTLIHKGLGDAIEVHHNMTSPATCNATSDAQARHDDLHRLTEHNLALEPATLGDYRCLAPFHYRSALPAAVTGGFRLVHRQPTVVGRYLKRECEHTIVGVLLRTLPHLACSLRDVATANRYRLAAKASATMLNREVRTIARVVIHPQWRGLGLAVTLVKHALARPEPETVYTEALAAMGRVHPFFEKAGMVRYERPPRPEHARLLDALQHVGLEPHTLASPRMVQAHFAERDAEWNLFRRELGRWYRAGARRSRKKRDEPSIDDMLAAARDQLLTRPIYYLHRHGA